MKFKLSWKDRLLIGFYMIISIPYIIKVIIFGPTTHIIGCEEEINKKLNEE